MLTDEEIAEYHKNGFLIKQQFFDEEEARILLTEAKQDTELSKNAVLRGDADGGVSKLTVWNHPVDDVYGMFSRSERLVDCVEQLLGEEVYHYHSKVMLKEPFVGGAWEWHQDYGYWYKNGCLYPLMLSVMIAIDQATKENGCLKVLKGSHCIGRINHGAAGEQLGADMRYVEAAMKKHELVYVELEAGDVFFMHCNTLHCSAQNKSPNPRWSYIIAYNSASNNPLWSHHHAQYTPIVKVPSNNPLWSHHHAQYTPIVKVPSTAIKERHWEENGHPQSKKQKLYNKQGDTGDRTEDH